MGKAILAWIRTNRHLVGAALWVFLAIPSLLWWKESVLWVIFISLYANYATEISAHHAQRAERKADAAEQRVNEVDDDY